MQLSVIEVHVRCPMKDSCLPQASVFAVVTSNSPPLIGETFSAGCASYRAKMNSNSSAIGPATEGAQRMARALEYKQSKKSAANVPSASQSESATTHSASSLVGALIQPRQCSHPRGWENMLHVSEVSRLLLRSDQKTTNVTSSTGSSTRFLSPTILTFESTINTSWPNRRLVAIPCIARHIRQLYTSILAHMNSSSQKPATFCTARRTARVLNEGCCRWKASWTTCAWTAQRLICQ